MKTRISPPVGIGIIVVVTVLLGWFLYRATSRQQMDTSASMPLELRQKILGAYGGGQSHSAPPGSPASRPGNR